MSNVVSFLVCDGRGIGREAAAMRSLAVGSLVVYNPTSPSLWLLGAAVTTPMSPDPLRWSAISLLLLLLLLRLLLLLLLLLGSWSH
jgi:hypothetical protein